MTMTVDEIIMEYRQAKDPEKQIRIMADQCLCKPSEIRQILRDAGVYQAKVRKPRNQTQPSAPEQTQQETPATPEPDQEAPKLEDIRPITAEPEGFSVSVDRRTLTPDLDEFLMKGLEDQPHVDRRASRFLPLYDIKDIKDSALDSIVESSKKLDGGPIEDFVERVRGILMLVERLEEQGGRND